MSENIFANLIEIFSSVQGEGKYLGCRQVFVRIADCNLRCAYCDTNFSRAEFCNVETFAGSMKFQPMKNPVSAIQTADIVKKFFEQVKTHSLSFTGGEPLLHWKFISEVSELVKNLGVKIFLETNGTLSDELEKILYVVDIISMDIKLPSVTGKNFFEEHKRFLKTAVQKDLYVKIVISDETSEPEFDTAINLLSEVSKNILLILQPVTPTANIKSASSKKILSLQARALDKIKDVRVIPQTHKVIDLL